MDSNMQDAQPNGAKKVSQINGLLSHDATSSLKAP